MSTRSRTVGSPDATRAVDWEQRIDFPRLRRERLERARASLERSELGAVLLFDPNNIRYVTSTHIGEWARDKNARFTLLARGADPILWDFGSAARHHRMFAPWLPEESFRAGVAPMRGAMPVETGIPDRLAAKIADELRELGLQDEPLGVDMADLVTIEALQRAGLHVTDGSAVLLDARKIKTAEEIALLDQSAGLVDAVYEEIYRMLRPGVYEHQIVARAHQLLFEMGSEQVEAVNAVSGDRCNPHPHVFSDRLLRPGDQAFFDIIHSFMGYRTCYYRTFNIGGVTPAQLDAYKQCREWLDAAITLVRPGMTTDRIAEVWPTAEELGFPDEETCFGLQFGHGIGVGLYESPMISRVHSLGRPGRARGGDGVRARDVLRRDRRALGGPDRGGGGRDRDGLRRHHALPRRGAPCGGSHLRAGRRPPAGRGEQPDRHRLGSRRRRGVLRRRQAGGRPRVTGETGTRELADGRPGYRLVRREDVALADALPGRSSGLTTCRLVDGTLGSTHMALTLVSLESGHVDAHVHSFETSFYVLEGEPVLYLEGRGVKLGPAACGAIPVGSPHAFRCSERALWIEMAAPRPRLDGSDTFFLGPAPDADAIPLDARDPRNHNLFLLTEGEMDLDLLKRGQAMGAPTVSGSMATAVLAYSGIAVKMLVDQRLDAQLHTMFMVDYEPRACANPHDHPFEESYYMLEGEVDVVANGDRHTLRPGDAFWTGTGCVHAFYEMQGARVRWLETSAPGPPPRHSYRHERDWDYLAERLSSDAEVGAR